MTNKYGIIMRTREGELIPMTEEGSDDEYLLQMYHLGKILRALPVEVSLLVQTKLIDRPVDPNRNYIGVVWAYPSLSEKQQQVFIDLESGKRELTKNTLPKILEELGPRDPRNKIPIDDVLKRLNAREGIKP